MPHQHRVPRRAGPHRHRQAAEVQAPRAVLGRPGATGQLRRLLLLAALVPALVLGWAGPIGAHTQVQEATPGPGDRVSGTVDRIELDFLDPLLSAPEIEVTGPDGERVAGLRAAELVADDVAVARFDPLAEAGRYTVTYEYASMDGAAQEGAHQFRFATGEGRHGFGLLPVSADVLRRFLHVLAATIWVGGQLVLAGLVPGLRAISSDAPRAVARRFDRIAWPAYGVLVATGIWNLAEVSFSDRTTAWQATLLVKLVLVAVSGGAALAHATARSTAVVAVGGALTGTASLCALFLGVQLALGA